MDTNIRTGESGPTPFRSSRFFCVGGNGTLPPGKGSTVAPLQHEKGRKSASSGSFMSSTCYRQSPAKCGFTEIAQDMNLGQGRARSSPLSL